ncbi:Hypothetical predicted protein [Paramuricea clavata]|uniref:Uncharacterized protein n=1 Tax=Paramuricea clavata TaxID=317549 RepID=A0A6S7K116_PARCT|nr:Hypothetical predicted protein [Paramuricea clavata]
MLSGFWIQAFLTVVCVFLLYTLSKIIRYLTGDARVLSSPNSAGSNRRRLGHFEEIFDMLSLDKSGNTNICVSISTTSKQSLVYQHVYDALVLLSKRQPMLRAVIATMANGDRYFEIKEINEVITMLDITTSDVNASDWQSVWFEYTVKPRGNGLLWRVVILQEEFMQDTKDYANTLMFNFNHSCIDGVCSVKFCEQFLNYMNKLGNGTSSADEEISSLDLLPYYHEIVTRGRIWHSLFNFILAYCGLKPVMKFCMEKMLYRVIQKRPNNPYHAQFPRNSEISTVVPCRLSVNVFTENKTKDIIQACKANDCTVTGAIAAATHLAFCKLIGPDKSMELGLPFTIEAQRFCVPKPHKDYLGYFAYSCENIYMKYVTGNTADFWKLAQETTQQIKDFVKKEAYVSEATVVNGLLEPRKLFDLWVSDDVFVKGGCNVMSSFGSFNFGNHQPEPYVLHECFINVLAHGLPYTFCHFIHTINGKMTWQIVSNDAVHTKHMEKFANLCFNILSKMSQNVA